jgi:transposase
MKVSNIMGMDVSKNTLDCYLFVQQKSLFAVSNNMKGFKTIKRWLTRELKEYKEGLLVVLEYTGIYTYGIERFLQSQQINFVTCIGH